MTRQECCNEIEKMLSKRRVVVTGIGLLTPLGIGIKENWTNLLAGKSGAVALDSEGILALVLKKRNGMII
jgi:hypothetical protein